MGAVMVTAGVVVSGIGSNVAVTVFEVVRTTVHCGPRTVSHPLQPARVDCESGAAVRTTDVPLANLAEQLAPQLIPDGVLVTVPAPLPARTTATENPDAIVNVRGFDVPPPGAGLTTVT
ncbi:MAG: hypothetical protein DMD93_22480 [Candidatus Rokuibacteriota bacterium]|nr:MAG: hypothetical protein DMD93_22480 [Candidatus Rokubacteria bacterium]